MLQRVKLDERDEFDYFWICSICYEMNTFDFWKHLKGEAILFQQMLCNKEKLREENNRRKSFAFEEGYSKIADVLDDIRVLIPAPQSDSDINNTLSKFSEEVNGNLKAIKAAILNKRSRDRKECKECHGIFSLEEFPRDEDVIGDKCWECEELDKADWIEADDTRDEEKVKRRKVNVDNSSDEDKEDSDSNDDEEEEKEEEEEEDDD